MLEIPKGMVSQDQMCKMVFQKPFILLKYSMIIRLLYDSGSVARWELLPILVEWSQLTECEDDKKTV